MCHESPPKKTFIYYVVEVTPTTSVCKRFVVKLVVALVFFQKKKGWVNDAIEPHSNLTQGKIKIEAALEVTYLPNIRAVRAVVPEEISRQLASANA